MNKKIISIITAAVMTAGMSLSVSAESSYDQLILDVKNRVGIPEEYNQFKSNGQYQGEDGKTSYMFIWTNEAEEEYNEIYLTCQDDGFITSYNRNTKSNGDYEMLGMDEDKAYDAAEKFVKQADPELDGIAELRVAEGYHYGGMTYDIYGIFHGIEYYNRIGRVVVNSDYTVTSFNAELPEIAAPAEGTEYIDNETAFAAYMEKIGPETVYRTYRDDEDNLCVFPAYQRRDRECINAVSGEAEKYDNYSYKNNFGTAEASAANDASGSGGGYRELNESELAQVAELNDLITKDEALGIIKERTGMELIPTSSSLRRNIDDGYSYSFTSDYFSAGVNAVNGDILYIYLSIKPGEEDSSAFAKYNFADGASASELIKMLAPTDGTLYSYNENESAEPENEDVKISSSDFVYLVNGIRVDGVSASASKSESEGGTYYSISISDLTAYKALEYVKPETFKSIDEVFNSADFVKLRYVESADGIKAAYITDTFLKNAVTGMDVNYRNETDDKVQSYTYSDIDSHWVKTTAEQLALAGIGFDGGELKPDQAVTEAEATELLGGLFHRVQPLNAENGNPAENAIDEPITRRGAAELIIKAMDLEKLAEMDIYAQPYSDVTEDFGAIAILKGYGVIASDTDTFRPDDTLTRAELLQLIYNTLTTAY